MHIMRFWITEKSGRMIYAILMEGETNRDLINVGEGRAKDDDRWKKSSVAALAEAIDHGLVEFLGFSQDSLRICAIGKYGQSRRHKFVRNSARTVLQNRIDRGLQVTEVKTIPTPENFPTPPPTQHHTRPQGFPTR